MQTEPLMAYQYMQLFVICYEWFKQGLMTEQSWYQQNITGFLTARSWLLGLSYSRLSLYDCQLACNSTQMRATEPNIPPKTSYHKKSRPTEPIRTKEKRQAQERMEKRSGAGDEGGRSHMGHKLRQQLRTVRNGGNSLVTCTPLNE